MKKVRRKLNRIGALALAVVLMGTTIEFPVIAAENCEHHTEHTEECGYKAAVEGSECTHVHGDECYSEEKKCVHNHDGECGYVEAVEGAECNHSHDENCGENGEECNHEHDDSCGYKKAQEGSECNHECSEESGCIETKENCNHTHDESCGYKAAVEGTPCIFVCDDCASEESGQEDEEENDTCICEDKCTADAVNEECPVCSLEEADLTLCAGEAVEEEEENDTCICEEKCTVDAVNEECPVCAAENADLNNCIGEATEEKIITAWSFIDEYECIDLETNTLALPGASAENVALKSDVISLLPTSIVATVNETEENITLSGWECEDYPETGAYAGTYTFTATLPVGYTLGEEVSELTVNVELGGAGLYDEEQTTGDFTVTGGTDGQDYTYDNEARLLTIKSSTEITIANVNPSTSTTDRIEVADGVSANITLAGVNIDVSSQIDTAAFKIADNSAGNVTITLADGTTNTLKSGTDCAGLQKNGEYSETLGKLTITGIGTLTATGGEDGAGIGGGGFGDGSNIKISGGVVIANGGGGAYGGAGIGGGSGGSGSNITISGGVVIANGGGGDYGGAGIGGGEGRDGSYIEISGGEVIANGGGAYGGAGIGGGDDCDGSNITINGGTVTATGGEYGAGIGGGHLGSGSNITINGGTVTATGGEDGAGIGGGYCGNADNIKISGGKVTATGGEYGAGIGGGISGSGSNITISGGVVIANGGSGAYDIGGSSTDNIKISGGSVKADTIGCTPTDGTANATPVYLLKFNVDGTSAVTINGKAYPTKHIDENKLYVYLPAGIYTVANGNSQKIYTIADNGYVSEFVVGTAFTITGTDLVYGTDYTYPASTGVLTILSDKDIAIKNANPSTPTTDRIEVADGVSANITLAGVNIDVPSQSYTAAFQIAENSTGDVTITLADGKTNTLKSGTYCAGLQKNGEYSETLGKLTITGTGTLTATGGDYGAGIGGGKSGSGSNIEISGGTVTATCGEGGAGIGGGWSGSGSDIKISGGTVTATGGEYGAGIGGGKSGSGSNIEISGGTVEAQGGDSGAGIGGGYYGSGSYITISGGTVKAQGGKNGAGIGGGDSYGQAVGCNIKISGGTVTATGGEKGAGIGGGYAGSGSNIEISGGTVTATGGNYGAGIGGGYNRSADNIKISGGEVTATGGEGGAGIGGGYNRSADNITISGGSVKAVAGEKYKYDGTTYFPAAIGQSVQYNESTSVHSNGAEVTPTDGNGNNVYLLELDVDGTSAVTINGKAYPTKHFDENKVYIYLPAGIYTVANGNSQKIYAIADNGDVSEVAFTITGTDLVYGTDYTYPADTGVLTILSDKAITIANTNLSTSTTDRIEVADGVSANITLAGVNIDVSSQSNTAAFKIADNSAGNVTITLADGTTNTLKSGGNCAGLQKNGAYSETLGKLTITGTGSLTATGGGFSAGIGGGGDSSSNIEISGGTVTATGGAGGAGIGGGEGRDGSNIEISGGEVTATGGEGGAGIGGGYYGSGSYITISGGTVTATGGDYGAGIGGGNRGSGSNITISGGVVIANGGGGAYGSAGIGGGAGGSGSNIEISGGTVTAEGGENGAGIGGGISGSGSNIKISGGTVTATGGNYGAGIGGGSSGSGSYITISGGKVTAAGGGYGAGIGGGISGSGSNIEISGGTVTATGGEKGAGIGGGYAGSADNIKISGGSVKADTIGCTPTDGTANATPVYLLKFKVDGTSAVTINGKAYPTKHIDENKLYVYLPAGIYTVANGNSQKIYAIADNGDVSEVVVGTAFTITGTDLVYSTDYTYPASTGVLTILSDKAMTIANANPSTPTTNRIEVADGVSANITLAGVNIDVPSQSYTAAFQIAENSTGDVTITLADGKTNTLKSGTYCAGLQKNGEYSETLGKLTITGTGTLTATGGDYGAGIGGGRYGSGSNIEISGGTVTATCGEGGAGIGGGWRGSGSDIKISGGTVTATGGENGAGIGGGKSDSGSNIESGSGSNIEISGGTVTATGGEYGAGIGGGYYGSGSYITISGGTVKAQGGKCGAGIGGGDSDGRAVGCNIKISGGTVTATGGEKGAGIGGGYAGSGSNIEISGGTVKAQGGNYGAGIGGGYNRSADNIKISGGEVTATGGEGGAGIGGGYNRSADNITISGGSVKAVAGEKYEYDGTTYFPAAIGQSVQYNDSTSVHSNGAEVTPTDGNGNNVYLLELDVDGTSAVTINGKAYPTKHFDENKVYIYLPAKTAQAPNEVTVGNETTKYCYINAKWLKVVDSPEADDTEFTYDGTEKTYTLAESENYTITGNKQTNAGTYTVTVALNDKDNPVWNDGTTEDKEYSFVIYKADSVLETVPTPKTGLIYKGEGQNLISAGTATGGTMQYSLNFVSWSPDIPSATDAGEYTVYYKIAGNENYNGSEADSFTVNIAKKQLTVTEVAATSRDYIANDKTVDITGITLSGKQGTDDVSVEITGLKGTLSSANADTYTSVTLPTLTLINDDRENYELVQPTSAVATNVTINKLNPTITLTVQTSITKTYGDEIFDLGATEDSPEAGLQYEVTKGADVVSVSSTGKVTILKAGDATITVTVPASTNYNSASKEISVTVEKAENAPNIPGNAMNVSNSYTKIGDVPLPTGWEWQDAYKETLLTVDNPETAKAVYTGADKGNYENESVEIVVTRADHDHVESEVLYDTNAGEHAPTCTEDGLGHVECTIEGCDETLRTNVVVDALGHNYVSKVTKQPTTTEEGIMTYTCSNCGDSYTKPISKLTPSGGGSNDDSDDEPGGSSGSSSGGSLGGSSDDSSAGMTEGGITSDKPVTQTPISQAPAENIVATATPQPGGNIPAAEPDEETDIPEPFIKGDDGKEGWDVIRDEVEDAEVGDTVTVDMNGTTVVPGDVLNDIKGKDITMVFDLGDGITWSVNGLSITSDNVGDIDFEVKVGADANDTIPVEVHNVVTGESYFVNISLAYDGEFGFEAVLSVNLEKENAGLYANLYYYNPQTNEMEFICSDVIAEDGTAELIFTHASEYTIVIDKVAMDAPASSEEGILPEIGVEAEDNSTKENNTEETSNTTEITSPKEIGTEEKSNTWLLLLLTGILAAAGIAGGVFYSKKKKSE